MIDLKIVYYPQQVERCYIWWCISVFAIKYNSGWIHQQKRYGILWWGRRGGYRADYCNHYITQCMFAHNPFVRCASNVAPLQRRLTLLRKQHVSRRLPLVRVYLSQVWLYSCKKIVQCARPMAHQTQHKQQQTNSPTCHPIAHAPTFANLQPLVLISSLVSTAVLQYTHC